LPASDLAALLSQSHPAPVRPENAAWRSGWQSAAPRGRFQRFQRVAAALAVLVPALVLMVLAARDPRAGVARWEHGDRQDALRAKERETDDFAAERAREESLAGGMTKFRDRFELEVFDRKAVDPHSVEYEEQQSRLERNLGVLDSVAGASAGEGVGQNRG